MANLAGFNAATVGDMQSFEAMPRDRYLAMIVESAMKPTKAGTGSFLEAKFQVLDGQFKGRNFWARMNLSNPNKQAEDIAQRELGAICKAVGIILPQDSAELHNRPMWVTLEVEPGRDGSSKPSNKPSKYEPANAMSGALAGGPPTSAGPTPGVHTPPPAQAAAPAKAPWQ